MYCSVVLIMNMNYLYNQKKEILSFGVNQVYMVVIG